jgi:hypothetical protein
MMQKTKILLIWISLFALAGIAGRLFDQPSLVGGFGKQIDVYGVKMYATDNVSDDKLLHAAGVMAQYLDNDEDGVADNQAVVDALIDQRAAMVIFADEREERRFDIDEFVDISGSEALQLLYADETFPGATAGNLHGEFDATLEEVLHLITQFGYALTYPDVWGESPGTDVAQAMDQARGGYFEDIPSRYPASAWYSYDDPTCEYDCQIAEYIYWALTSLLGAQEYPGRLEEIGHEWKLNTPDLVKTRDVAIYELLIEPQYGFAKILPDGDFQGFELFIERFGD